MQGRKSERDLARLCIDITLQQRNNGRLKFDLDELKVTAASCVRSCSHFLFFLFVSSLCAVRGRIPASSLNAVPP
jgi:hypothetical protein